MVRPVSHYSHTCPVSEKTAADCRLRCNILDQLLSGIVFVLIQCVGGGAAGVYGHWEYVRICAVSHVGGQHCHGIFSVDCLGTYENRRMVSKKVGGFCEKRKKYPPYEKNVKNLLQISFILCIMKIGQFYPLGVIFCILTIGGDGVG